MKRNQIAAVAIFTVPVILGLVYLGLVADSKAQQNQMTVKSLYVQADRFYNDGQFERASGFYQKIISIDRAEEKAWHELGKYYNRFEMCEESLNHYLEYTRLFQDSSRAVEGYEIAKQCRSGTNRF